MQEGEGEKKKKNSLEGGQKEWEVLLRWLESRVRIPAAPRGEGGCGGMHEYST
jgi:hypothetical protein